MTLAATRPTTQAAIDPRHAEALDALERGGRLRSPDRIDAHLEDHLRALREGPLHPPLASWPGRETLVGELLLNLADPGRINQGFKGTCAATCVESWLAERWPGEYARLVAALCAPEGVAELPGREPLVRHDSQLAPDAQERRSPISRLFQAACMEYAYAELDYCEDRDRQIDAEGRVAGLGMRLEAFDRLLDALSGQDFATLCTKDSAVSRMMRELGLGGGLELQRDGLDIIRRSLAAGEPIFATIVVEQADWRGEPDKPHEAAGPSDADMHHAAHKIRVLAVEGERVVFEDPLDPSVPWLAGVDVELQDHQGRAAMALEDFERLLVELSYLPQHAEPR